MEQIFVYKDGNLFQAYNLKCRRIYVYFIYNYNNPLFVVRYTSDDK